MFSSSQFDFSQSSEAAPSPSPAKSRGVQELVPLTVKQISEASNPGGEKFHLPMDEIDSVNVTLVGMVFEKNERVTDVGFTLDDGTGRIECKRWVNETFDTKQMEDIHDDRYVRVIGNLKTFQGKRQIAVFSARPVIDFNEVTFHFIECIHFYLKKSKLQLQGAPAMHSQVIESSQSTPVKIESNGYQAASMNQSPAQFSADGRKDYNQMILDYLQQPLISERAEGVHKDELSKQLKLPTEKIMETIRSLEDEGLIYSTIDEFHFKST